MASYVVYRVLTAVCDMLPDARLAVYYAEASDYSPTELEWKRSLRALATRQTIC